MIAKVLGFHREHNLGVVQFGTSDQDTFQYRSSGEAIKGNLLEVRELNNAGSVNTLLVINHSDQFVLLLDGDILSGAKQNRVVNTSILLAPHSKTEIPVSCVERGRWNRRSDTFYETKYTAPASFRGEKARQVRESLKRNQTFSAEQGAIWDRVRQYESAHKLASPTSNLSDLFDAREGEFEKLLATFPVQPHANGIALFVSRTLASLDLFNSTSVYAQYFPKLIRGAAFEGLLAGKKKEDLSRSEAEFATLDLLDRLEAVAYEDYPAVGVGTDRRFELPPMYGFRLEYDHHLIHLTALRSATPSQS